MSDLVLKVPKDKKLKTTKSYVIPYLVWSLIFLVVPVFLLIFMAFTTYNFSTNSEVNATLYNWSYVFGNSEKVRVFWQAVLKSFKISFLVTLFCFIIGYPTAYFMTKIKAKYRAILMALLILPLWSNQVLRIVSWRTIFEVLHMNNNNLYEFNIVVAMISMYLPFMIIPIYTVLEKMDPKLIEASYDLGCNRAKSFIKVVFPLSLGGIVSGIVMTLLPALTQFEVSDAISYNNVQLLGNLIYTRFKGTGGFNVGSVFSLFTIAFTIVGFVLLLKVDKEGETLI
ncbi:MAG: ABC transporter permease [Gammaproteobacteria bacterium]|nr:ABC transporter permease [Gammaproteobacteria bacterium]